MTEISKEQAPKLSDIKQNTTETEQKKPNEKQIRQKEFITQFIDPYNKEFNLQINIFSKMLTKIRNDNLAGKLMDELSFKNWFGLARLKNLVTQWEFTSNTDNEIKQLDYYIELTISRKRWLNTLYKWLTQWKTIEEMLNNSFVKIFIESPEWTWMMSAMKNPEKAKDFEHQYYLNKAREITTKIPWWSVIALSLYNRLEWTNLQDTAIKEKPTKIEMFWDKYLSQIMKEINLTDLLIPESGIIQALNISGKFKNVVANY